jgi:hypothetical protein
MALGDQSLDQKELGYRTGYLRRQCGHRIKGDRWGEESHRI